MRGGPWGAEAVNLLVKDLLKTGPIRPQGRWYPGEPVLITRSDYHTGLFNGNIGLSLPDPGSDHELRAYFPSMRAP
jgi:exodeoxyribonuclease V alpha subunit